MSESKNIRKHDSVRVVPLATPELAQKIAARQSAQLVYNHGPLIAHAQVFPIFWGTAWEQAVLAAMIPEVNEFFDYILTSPLIDQLAEYSIPQHSIGHGKRIGSVALTSPDVPKTVDDSAIQKMIQQQISSGKFPPTSPDLLYFVFLPSGVIVTQRGSESCKALPRRDRQGCVLRRHAVPRLFRMLFESVHFRCAHCYRISRTVRSHYRSSARRGMVCDNQNGEIGDICAWQTKKVGAYSIQKEWSNKAGSCI